MNPIRHIRHILLLLLLVSFIGAGAAAADKVVVTSGRVVYDAFGRVVKVYHPTVDGDTVTAFRCAIDTVPPTVTAYDVLDRPVKVTYPDNSVTETDYSVSGHVQVTTVTDALGNVSKTHVDGSGRTVKSIRFESPGCQDSIVTSFTYDGIGRLVEVLDADSNVTVSEYDMGDRRVRVSHPASGETTFTYDVLGNVLTRQTANLRDSSLFIVYGYDRGRLVSVSYPEHPENNVEYYYGDVNNGDQAKGRLCFRRDATGGEQYGYDNLGNVCLRLRTVTVPNEDVGTFLTEFEYDSYGKLLSMTYPDGELVCYWYDGSGQLTEVYESDRLLGDRYVKEIGYDEFGDRVYMEYGNGAVSSYSYDSRMRRLSGLSVSKPGGFTLERTYVYDAVGNILSLTNSGTGLLYTPPVSHRYVYDGLYRLTEAYGNEDDPQTGYELLMSYDKMYRITGKEQRMWQTNAQFLGTLNAGYKLSYTYDRSPGKRFRMSTVSDVNYRTVGTPDDGDHIGESHRYGYDHNGNLLHVNTRRVTADGKTKDLAREEKFRWDEENRLIAISQDGYVSNYWYDGDGERVIKEHGGNHAVFVNSAQDSVLTDTRQFTIYPSAYFVVHNGNWFTKHIYIGSERIASRMGSMRGLLSQAFVNRPVAGSSDNIEDLLYDDQCDMMALVMKSNYEYFDLPYNGQNRHDLNGAMVGTQPRGGSSGARYYWMLAGTEDTEGDGGEGGEGGGPSGAPRRGNKVDGEGNRYYYHSDHLGSSMLITDETGDVTQQLDYLPYGEVFLERRKQDPDVDYFTPYKFNGKELDEETGLYYYGARYMNPRLSIWYGVDPISNYDPLNNENYLDGEHNKGIYNQQNLNPFCYCYNSPVILIDPNGKQTSFIKWWNENQMSTRTIGFIKGVGGLLEAGTGAVGGTATSWTGVGAVVGGAAVVHGCDVAVSGFNQMVRGQETSSFTSQGLQALGLSRKNAEMLDNGISILFSIGSSAAIRFSDKGIAQATLSSVSTRSKNSFFYNTRYTDKVKAQMMKGDYHSFPESVTAYEKAGKVTKIVGGDGVTRTKLTIPGSYKGRNGVFEFIKEQNGDINHRLFKPTN